MINDNNRRMEGPALVSTAIVARRGIHVRVLADSVSVNSRMHTNRFKAQPQV